MWNSSRLGLDHESRSDSSFNQSAEPVERGVLFFLVGTGPKKCDFARVPLDQRHTDRLFLEEYGQPAGLRRDNDGTEQGFCFYGSMAHSILS